MKPSTCITPAIQADAKYTWHGIIAPLTSQQLIQVSGDGC